MNLRRQPRKEYNCKNYNDNVFDITDKAQGGRSIPLQLNSDKFEITEETFDKADTEYMFLIKTLGYKEGLNGENNATLDTYRRARWGGNEYDSNKWELAI